MTTETHSLETKHFDSKERKMKKNRIQAGGVLVLPALFLAAVATAVPASAQVANTFWASLIPGEYGTFRIDPVSLQRTGTFTVDTPGSLSVRFGSPSETFTAQLTSPSGEVILGDDPSGRSATLTFKDSDPDAVGRDVIFQIGAAEPGLWQYRVSETVPPSPEIFFRYEFIMESTVASGFIDDGRAFRVDRPIAVTVLTTERGEPRTTGLTITGSVRRVGETGPVPNATFRDDGQGIDPVAGDGFFTADLSGAEPGEYAVRAQIEGLNAEGFAFRRATYGRVVVKEICATLDAGFDEQAIDANTDGLIDAVRFDFQLDVEEAGSYLVNAVLRSASGHPLQSSSSVDLLPGIGQTVSVEFSAEDLRFDLAEDGPYLVERVFVIDEDGDMCDGRLEMGETAAYSVASYQRDAIELDRANIFAEGVDTNDDGLFDFLDVRLPLWVTRNGFYSYSSFLQTESGDPLGFQTGGWSLSGQSTQTLRFPGFPIGSSETEEGLFVRGFALWGQGENLIQIELPVLQGVEACQFVGSPQPCLGNEPPDTSGAVASPSELWPPNHKMKAVIITGVSDPDGDPVTIEVTGITQDEPVDGPGRNHDPDGGGVGTATPEVRAERDGRGDGRVYVVSFVADDGRGGTSPGSVSVCVPHDRGNGGCVDSGQMYDSVNGGGAFAQKLTLGAQKARGGNGGDSPPAIESGCAYDVETWLSARDAWPATTVDVGSDTLTAFELGSLLAPGDGNALYEVARQLVAAGLNLANGAGGELPDLAISAGELLSVMPLGSFLEGEDKALADSLADALAAANGAGCGS